MADYAAAPIQPILQGLVTIDQNNNPQFFGRGASAVARITGQLVGCFVFPFQFEVIVWRGNATPSDYLAQIIGPLI
jgi:hypothetical protein